MTESWELLHCGYQDSRSMLNLEILLICGLIQSLDILNGSLYPEWITEMKRLSIDPEIKGVPTVDIWI